MLGASGLIGNPSTATDGGSAGVEAQELSGGSGGGGGQGSFSEDDKVRVEEGERAAGGNRWPRQETLALLKIRSDMDVAFRDSSLKGPLWEEISRKMADHGYHRNPKKCKEKFENVFKYHKRTKGGRTSKPDGKTYRFFDQLEALENTISPSPTSYLLPPPPRQQSQAPPQTTTMADPMQAVHPNPTSHMAPQHQVATVSSTQNSSPTPQSFANLMSSTFPPPQGIFQPQTTTPIGATAADVANTVNSLSFLSNSTSSSSSTSSDEDMEQRQKRKRKWKDLFNRLMKDVINKQEELQKSFLESLEKRERDRMAREEAWRVQEMARINREHDLLVQERSMVAARESALITFLHQMSNNQSPGNQNNSNKPPTITTKVTTTTASTVVSLPQVQAPVQHTVTPPPSTPQPQMQQPCPPTPVTIAPTLTITPPILSTPPPQIRPGEQTPKSDNGGGGVESYMGTTSSRWPKTEVEALIKLRTELDNKYQENVPKGPLWEEISSGMRKIGYNRNAKRCKEKWENINKYFKKVKESNKKRPEDSKTCPYFHQLDALYREKASVVKPESSMLPIMAQPENQWPLQQGHVQPLQQQMFQQQGGTMEEQEGDNIDDHEDDDEDGDGNEDDEGSA